MPPPGRLAEPGWSCDDAAAPPAAALYRRAADAAARQGALAVVVCDLVADGPARLLERSLELTRWIRRELLGQVDEAGAHPIIDALAAAASPLSLVGLWRRRRRVDLWSAILFVHDDPPAWAAPLLPGASHEQGRHPIVVGLLAADRLLLPPGTTRDGRRLVQTVQSLLGPA